MKVFNVNTLSKGRLALSAALLGLVLSVIPQFAVAAENVRFLDLTGHWVGYTAIALFVFAYALVIVEVFVQKRYVSLFAGYR